MPNEVSTNRIRPQSINIPEKKELYRCYMPFIKHGGLFIPFNEEVGPNQISPGQNIFIVLTILDQRNKIPIHGKVVWISKGGMQKGYGVSLGNTPAMKALKESIETAIMDFTTKKEATYTI